MYVFGPQFVLNVVVIIPHQANYKTTTYKNQAKPTNKTCMLHVIALPRLEDRHAPQQLPLLLLHFGVLLDQDADRV